MIMFEILKIWFVWNGSFDKIYVGNQRLFMEMVVKYYTKNKG